MSSYTMQHYSCTVALTITRILEGEMGLWFEIIGVDGTSKENILVRYECGRGDTKYHEGVYNVGFSNSVQEILGFLQQAAVDYAHEAETTDGQLWILYGGKRVEQQPDGTWKIVER